MAVNPNEPRRKPVQPLETREECAGAPPRARRCRRSSGGREIALAEGEGLLELSRLTGYPVRDPEGVYGHGEKRVARHQEREGTLV